MIKCIVSSCLLLATAAVASAAGLSPIICDGVYPYHLQGVATDGTNLFWSFTSVLVKTDKAGMVLAKDEICLGDGHMGDLCCKGGKVFVGMNMGRDGRGWKKDDEVWQYDGEGMKREKAFPTPHTIWCNNGIEWFDGYFWLIGSIPKFSEYNIVFKYNPDFRFCGARLVASGWTNLGVQTICRYGDVVLFGCYGTPKKDDPNAHESSTLVVNAKSLTEKPSAEYPSIAPVLKRFNSYTAEGMLVMDGTLWVAYGFKKVPNATGNEPCWSAKLIPGQYSKELDGLSDSAGMSTRK